MLVTQDVRVQTTYCIFTKAITLQTYSITFPGEVLFNAIKRGFLHNSGTHVTSFFAFNFSFLFLLGDVLLVCLLYGKVGDPMALLRSHIYLGAGVGSTVRTVCR